GFTYLVYASAYSKPEVVSAFLASGADINQQSMNGWTPLAIAIQYDNRDVYHELIEMDAQVFYSQSIHDATPSITPLAVAVNKKNSDATELLLTTWLGNGTSNFEYLNEDNIQNINLELRPIGVSVKFKESISIADFTTNITNALKETDALTNP
ncbi:MAG: ankyrin repeat domain-containing protein, partial [Salinispira sp.]